MSPASPWRVPLLLLLLLTLAALTAVSSGSLSRCPDGHYQSPEDPAHCLKCSTCPKNQIIRKPCRKHSNTLCGPFFEFHEFHQAPRPSLEVGDLPLPDEGGGGVVAGGGGMGVGGIFGDGSAAEADANRSQMFQDLLETLDRKPERSKHHPHQRNNKHHKGVPGNRKGRDPGRDDDDDVEVFPDVSSGPSSAGGASRPKLRAGASASARPRHRQDGQVPSLQNPEDEENQWKVLALALIVVLCVVCVFLIVFVFVVCYMRSRRAHLKKVLYSADSGPTARSAGRSFPSLRYVPVLTHAQARAGSSGGAMSAPPCGMVDSSYLYSDEYDADNSGQTISTTKSSDYVYFKSPHNGNTIYDV